MTMLRILFGYGQTMGLANCEKLKGILAEMRFKDAPPRKIVITYQQVIAFIQKAHELGRPELALAQALQFEGTLRQIDVIGEWVPDPERPSATRWANGLLWQHFRDYVLVKETTKTGQEADTEGAYRRLEQAFRKLIPQAEIDHRWSGQVIETQDGLPYIGETADGQFVATGFGGNGMTFGTLGAMMAAGEIQKRIFIRIGLEDD